MASKFLPKWQNWQILSKNLTNWFVTPATKFFTFVYQKITLRKNVNLWSNSDEWAWKFLSVGALGWQNLQIGRFFGILAHPPWPISPKKSGWTTLPNLIKNTPLTKSSACPYCPQMTARHFVPLRWWFWRHGYSQWTTLVVRTKWKFCPFVKPA